MPIGARIARSITSSPLKLASTTRSPRVPVLRSTAMASTTPQTMTHFDSKYCPYAQRSWIALLEKQLPFTIREVDLKNKDEEFKKVYASLHPDPEAPAKVPILYDGDTKLIESIVVVEYLASKYRSHGNDILPADEADLARCRLFVELFTNYINSAMFGLYKADSHDAVKAGREKLVYGLRIMDECLRRHGHENGGSYYLGGHFSIADVITTPFLQRVLVTIPGYRNIDVWEIIREEKLERFHRWADAVLARPSSQETKPTDEVILSSLRKFVVEIN